MTSKKLDKELFAWRLIFSTFVILFVAFVGVKALPNSSDTVTVTASIAPQRIVIVNKDLKIIAIYSNTKENIRPSVFLDRLDGTELPYSDSVIRQYESLKPTLNFSQPGEVYKEPHPSTASRVYNNIIRVYQRVINIVIPWQH